MTHRPAEEGLPSRPNGSKAAVPLMALLGAALAFAGIHLVLSMPGIPYNIRDLFGTSHRTSGIAVFSLILLWVGFAPGAVSRIVMNRPMRVLGLPLAAAVIALVSWFALRFAVASKSLLDIVGTATLGIGKEWEWIGRFLAVGGGTMLLLILAGTIASAVLELGWRRGVALAWRALAISLPFLILARIVVINWASTDNIVELLRADPWPGDIPMMILIMLLGANAAALAHCTGAWKGKRMLLAALTTAALVVPGWALVNLALEPSLHKYDLVFPAIRFLLGPDRQTPLSDSELMMRWTAVQIGAVVVLAYGWRMAMLVIRPRGVQTADHTQDKGM